MKKRTIALCIVLVVCLIAGGLLLYQEWKARQPPKILQSGMNEISTSPDVTATPDTFVLESDIPIEETETPAPAQDNDSAHTPESSGFGTVTIKNKTFPVKRGVSEKALAENIGWMESSAMPGEDGTCILMGHRNQQFRILKDVQAGDKIIIGVSNGISYTYIVQFAKIVESDKALRFEVSEGKTLALITCYPFFYRGHAPQKFVVTAVIE